MISGVYHHIESNDNRSLDDTSIVLGNNTQLSGSKSIRLNNCHGNIMVRRVSFVPKLLK